MTSGQKIAFSLLTAMILFAGFFVVSQSGLLTELETRYYSQSKIREKVESLDNISESLDSYITSFLSKLKTDQEDKVAFLNSPAVISYVEANNPSEEYISERRRLTEALFTEYPSLKGLRIIDKNGRNVHYSSFDSTDILRQSGITKYYKFYQDIIRDADELEISSIAINESTLEDRVLIDAAKKRIVVSMPLKLRSIFQASVIFYFDIHEIQEELVNSEVISLGQNLSAFTNGSDLEGFVLNVPVKYYDDFSTPIFESWKLPKSKFDGELLTQPEKILEIDDGRFWVLITSSRSKYFKVSGVYTSDIFELSREVKYLIYITVGLSLFLIAFLCFSLKTDKKVVIKKRIKKIQYSIISEYLDNKERIEWSIVVNQLKAKKDDLSEEILKSAGVKSKKKAEKLKLDEFLEQSWEQIFAVIAPEIQENKVENKYVPSTPTNTVSGITLDQLRSVIEEVLQDTKLNVQVNNISEIKKAPKPAAIPDDVEEIEEVEEVLDDVEEIEEVEEVLDDVEEIEEVEEVLDDVEEIEEAEEVLDDVEEIEVTDEFIVENNPLSLVQALGGGVQYQYHSANDSFIRGELFPTVENLFAEELTTGSEYIKQSEPGAVLDFKVSKYSYQSKDAEIVEETAVEEGIDDAEEIEEMLDEETSIEDNSELLAGELEELDESEMFITNDYFAMTKFGANTNNIQDLESASDAIFENEEGLFEIADDIEYSKVTVNQGLKNLVDSITK